MPWTVLDAGQAEDRGWLRLGVDVVGCPVSATRHVAVDASGLRLDYTLTNHGTGDLPVLWAGHGLLAAPPGSRGRAAGGQRESAWRVTASSLTDDSAAASSRTSPAGRTAWLSTILPRAAG